MSSTVASSTLSLSSVSESTSDSLSSTVASSTLSLSSVSESSSDSLSTTVVSSTLALSSVSVSSSDSLSSTVASSTLLLSPMPKSLLSLLVAAASLSTSCEIELFSDSPASLTISEVLFSGVVSPSPLERVTSGLSPTLLPVSKFWFSTLFTCSWLSETWFWIGISILGIPKSGAFCWSWLGVSSWTLLKVSLLFWVLSEIWLSWGASLICCWTSSEEDGASVEAVGGAWFCTKEGSYLTIWEFKTLLLI